MTKAGVLTFDLEGKPMDVRDHERDNRNLMTQPGGETADFEKVVQELWNEFCAGVGNFEVTPNDFFKKGVYREFKATTKPAYDAGAFGQGTPERAKADRCCRKTGVIVRAMTEVQGSDKIVEGDFGEAWKLVKRLSGRRPADHGGVC